MALAQSALSNQMMMMMMLSQGYVEETREIKWKGVSVPMGQGGLRLVCVRHNWRRIGHPLKGTCTHHPIYRDASLLSCKLSPRLHQRKGACMSVHWMVGFTVNATRPKHGIKATLSLPVSLCMSQFDTWFSLLLALASLSLFYAGAWASWVNNCGLDWVISMARAFSSPSPSSHTSLKLIR